MRLLRPARTRGILTPQEGTLSNAAWPQQQAPGQHDRRKAQGGGLRGAPLPRTRELDPFALQRAARAALTVTCEIKVKCQLEESSVN